MPRLPAIFSCRALSFLIAIVIASLFSLTARSQSQKLITSDSLLDTGSPLSTTYNAPGTSGQNGSVQLATNNSVTLWLMYDNPWGVSSGSGTITQNYSGSGSLTTAINLSGLPGGGVDGSPFVLYGCDQYSDCINGQPPQFPKQLASMTSLIVDFSYAVTGAITGSRNVDVIFDEWVCNSNHPTGIPQCLEVEVLPYYSFASGGRGGTFVRTFNEPVTLNGTASTLSFDEYIWGQDVLFYPSGSGSGLSSAEIRFNLLDFLNSAVAAYGNSSFSWLAGVELGTEFGGSSSQSYQLTISKLDIEQTLGSLPTPPTSLTVVVN